MPPLKDVNLPRGTVVAVTPSKQISVRIRTRPLPAAVTDFLIKNSTSIKTLYATRRGAEKLESGEAAGAVSEEERLSQAKLKLMEIEEIKQGLKKAFDTAPSKERDVWAGVIDNIVAFGPRRIGPNLLIDSTLAGGFRKL